MRKINSSDAVDVFTDIVNFAVDNDISLPDNVVLLGGMALSYLGIREMSNDIDAYSVNVESLYHISEILMPKWKESYGNDFEIDFTNNETIWTNDINVGNINKLENVVFIKDKNGEPAMGISVIDAETIFVLKSYADREKDKDDLQKIFSVSCKENILKKLDELAVFNRGHTNQTMIEMTLGNVQEFSFELIEAKDIFNIKNIDEETRLNIASIFGVEDELLDILNGCMDDSSDDRWFSFRRS